MPPHSNYRLRCFDRVYHHGKIPACPRKFGRIVVVVAKRREPCLVLGFRGPVQAPVNTTPLPWHGPPPLCADALTGQFRFNPLTLVNFFFNNLPFITPLFSRFTLPLVRSYLTFLPHVHVPKFRPSHLSMEVMDWILSQYGIAGLLQNQPTAQLCGPRDALRRPCVQRRAA